MSQKILLSQRLVNKDEYNETWECLDTRWAVFIQRLGCIPIPISLNGWIDDYLQNIGDVKGVILTGGNDLSRINPNLQNKLRDELENKIIDKCIELDIPVIGVCRGMQKMAEYFNLEICKIENHVKIYHDVFTEEKDGIFNTYGDNFIVNSYHNYTIAEASNEFSEIVRSSNDNSIEAFKHKNLRLAGIMWHPEREENFNGNDINFFKKFFNLGNI